MAAQPPPPPAPPPPPPAPPLIPDPLRVALEFARTTAQSEIQNIERLHDKTLKALAILVGVLSILGFGLGFFGYTNLKEIAINSAKAQMQSTVTDQIAAWMKTERVEQIIQAQLKAKTEADLEGIINRQVAQEVKSQGAAIERSVQEHTKALVAEMKPQIDDLASKEAKRLVEEELAPRTFTKEQVALLNDASEPYRKQHLIARVRAYSLEPEEMLYAQQLSDALQTAGWTASFEGGTGQPGFPLPLEFGVFIMVKDQKNPPPGTEELQRVLKAAHVSTNVFQSDAAFTYHNSTGDHPVPTLVVGSRFRTMPDPATRP